MNGDRNTATAKPPSETSAPNGTGLTENKRDARGAAYWLSWLRSYFFFFPMICAYTGILGTLSLLVSRFDKSGLRQQGLAVLWAKLILKTCFSPVEVTGLERLDASRPQIYCANHISAMDIPVLYASLPFQFRILAKTELFSVPFIGGHLRRSGQLPVDQSNARASLRTLNIAVEALKNGMPVLIFPEGGRSSDGRIMPFMSGPFYAAIKSQADIVPMAIVNTFEMLPMNNYHVHPHRLKLIVGEPISPAGYTMKESAKLSERVQQSIEDLYYASSRIRRAE